MEFRLIEIRGLELLQKSKTNLSKVFGLGKASKEKPSALLGNARETFEAIEQEIKYNA